MNYRVSFYKKPPKGMTLVENENGYTIHINSVDWNFFPLWIILIGLTLTSVIAILINGVYVLLAGAAVLFYFSYLLTPLVFIKAKLILEKNLFKLYAFTDIMLKRAPYIIELEYINNIRVIATSSGNGDFTKWGRTGYNHIELSSNDREKRDTISIYTKEFNIYISQFLKEYIKLLQNQPKENSPV
jgi:hypothetical protein